MADRQPKRKAREAASYSLDYHVTFSFKHRVVSLAIESEVREDRRDRQIIKNKHWEMVESGDYLEQWVRFRHNQPFDPRELQATTAAIEILDAACEAMTNGTKAGEQHAT